MTLIDIFIINYHSATQTQQAIDRLGNDQRWQFHILDNSNNTQEWATLEKLIPPYAQAIRSPSNLGFAQGCNYLWQGTEAPYVLLLNPDAYLSSAQLEELLDTLLDKPERAAVAPLMAWDEKHHWFIPRATPQRPIEAIWRYLEAHCNILWRRRWKRYYQTLCEDLRKHSFLKQDFLSGAILLVRRSAIEDINRITGSHELFDPQFFMFFEDADLSMRIRAKHYQLGVCRTTIAQHQYHHHPQKASLMQTSAQNYWHKHWPQKIASWLSNYNWSPLEKRMRQRFSLAPSFDDPQSLETYLQTHHLNLVAWSPSPWLKPCIYRPFHHAEQLTTRGLTQQQWGNLAQGNYYAAALNHEQKYTLILLQKHIDHI